MKKAQAIKLWNTLGDSTNVKEVIIGFSNKKGYGGKRTLERYSQATAGFKEGLSFQDIAVKTGWSTDYIGKICTWWKEAFPGLEVSPEPQPINSRGALQDTPSQSASVQTQPIVENDALMMEKYKDIMNEFESDKASLNRGRIKNMAVKNEGNLKKAVDAARNAEYVNKKRDAFEELELNGLAIAETVASFEKMSTWLIGDDRLQDMFKPWFWQTVLDCWMPLKTWVNFRLTTKGEYHLVGFGQGFKQLAICAKQKLGNDALKYQID